MKTILLLAISFMLIGCANFKNHEIKFGKACFNKADGTVSWSYVWIKDKQTTFDKCPDVKR
jgi:hypothetical protein|tara:strand:- start:613 stop:795 length:183 start_codon:yes stop_codon:yes gene_type:complete